MVTFAGLTRPIAGMAVLTTLVLATPSAAAGPATAASPPAAAALPRLSAPLGLSFGMRPEEALAMGLVSRVVAPDQVLPVAKTTARQIAAIDPALVAATKRSLNRTFEIMGMERALQEALLTDIAVEAIGTPDKAQFLDILRRAGLATARRWRNERFVQPAGMEQ